MQSAPPCRAPAPHGFSLIEVLVALGLVALAASLILVTAAPDASRRANMKRVADFVHASEATALSGGAPVGLRLAERRLIREVWRAGAWQETAHLDLPRGLDVAIDTGGRALPDALSEREALDWPAVIFDPLGHTMPIRIEIEAGPESIEIVAGRDLTGSAP